LELITKKQVNIFDIYTPATYEELAEALELKLQNEQRGVSSGETPRGAERTVAPKAPVVDEDDDNVVVPSDDEIEAATSTPTPVVEVAKAKKSNTSIEDFEAAFKNIFPEKKS